MKRFQPAIILVLIAAAMLGAGCISQETKTDTVSGADALFLRGEAEFQKQNLHAAAELFTQAQEAYMASGNISASLHARDRVTVARILVLQYPFNRSQIEAIVNEQFPNISAERKASFLTPVNSMSIQSDGETWYMDRTVSNILYHNMDLMRESTRMKGDTPFYDQMAPYAFAPAMPEKGVYRDPVTWEGTETLTIPREKLPKTGTFRVWVYLPVETDSQKNVTILSLEPARYLTSTTGTNGDIGIAYFEVPLDQVSGSHLNITAKFRFTQYEQRYVIDPEKVGTYTTSDPEYIRYTSASRNIALTPGLKTEAEKIVGNETNPYRKAQKIYWHVIKMPYSSLSYARLLAHDSSTQPISEYVRTTGWGDCGAQSAYFAALCRASGIPARAIGGWQMIPGYGGGHFWSEYYLPGYGWIPNDVTIAEGADWSFNATDADRQRYKAYYGENLDPYRYIIQKDVDIPLVPENTDVTTQDFTFQSARAICDTCTTDPILWLPEYEHVAIVMVGGPGD
ncbi:MAG: transglutaminase domain-containing protein [Methanolinea sp.]